jgi:hypothetical protein
MTAAARRPAIRALALLARLEKQALDRRRLELLAIEGRLGEDRREALALGAALTREHATAWALPGGPAPFTAYAAAASARRQELEAGIAALERAQAQAEAALREVMRRYKALELGAERLQAREEEQLCRRADTTREETALLRTAARAGPAG